MERAAASPSLICKIRMKLLFVLLAVAFNLRAYVLPLLLLWSCWVQTEMQGSFWQVFLCEKTPFILGSWTCVGVHFTSCPVGNAEQPCSVILLFRCALYIDFPAATSYSVQRQCLMVMPMIGGGEIKKTARQKLKLWTYNVDLSISVRQLRVEMFIAAANACCTSGVQALTTSAAAAGSHEFKGALTGRGGAKALGGLNRAPNY